MRWASLLSGGRVFWRGGSGDQILFSELPDKPFLRQELAPTSQKYLLSDGSVFYEGHGRVFYQVGALLF